MLSFNGDPSLEGAQAVSFWERGAVRIEDGIISAVGSDLSVPETVSVTDYGDRLICAGFVDGHVHYPATGTQWVPRHVVSVSDFIAKTGAPDSDALN